MEDIMSNVIKGMIAGFVATIVLSMLMFMKSMMGVMPELDVVAMLSAMMGQSDTLAIGWVMHFVIGTVVWGILFSLLVSSLPGGSIVTKGLIFGAGAWLLMMIVVMPMAGAGLFGMKLGMMAPMMTLILHVIFGAVLGVVYQMLAGPDYATS